MQELHTLLTSDQEQKNVFEDISVEGFRDGKILKKFFWLTPSYEMLNKQEDLNYVEKNRQLCDFVHDADAFSTKACCEIFKMQNGLLNCNSQKLVYFLKCKIFGEDHHIVKVKTKFRVKFDDYEN